MRFLFAIVGGVIGLYVAESKYGYAGDFSNSVLNMLFGGKIQTFFGVIPVHIKFEAWGIIVVGLVLGFFVSSFSKTFKEKLQQLQESKSDNLKKNNAVNVSEALKNYSSLLKDGVITQEEFEVKKKELLDIKG